MNLKEIKEIVRKQNEWRGKQTVNLIASENIMLPEARELYCSDFMHRYAEGEPYQRYYNGTKYIDELEAATREYFAEHFGVDCVDVRPISGTLANLAVFSALLNKQYIASHKLINGGHLSHNKVGFLGKILKAGVHPIRVLYPDGLITDVESLITQIEIVDPDFVVLGKSLFLFEEPVREIRERFPNLTIVYDAAHVFGLIYQGVFQKDLFEYVDVVTASTHKTFPGPQGGIILVKEKKLYDKISKFVFPGTVSNHHLHRIPALLATAVLLDSKYKDYSARVVQNAKYFAEKLYEQGFKVLAKKHGFTQTHQILIDVSEFGGGRKVADKLEEHDIIVNANALPAKDRNFKEVSGIRIGVQEMTLRGWGKKEFADLAKRMREVIQ
jgi:glycine hydroxymethyltransferase